MKKLLSIAVIAMGMATAGAQEAGLQLSLTPEVAIHPTDTTIHGLSVNLFGENPQHGVALGVVNGSTGNSSGFSWAFLVNYADSYTGVQWAGVNYTRDEFTGWQNGLFNYAKTGTGFQSGFVNVSGDFNGLQFGLFNYTDSLRGVQVGAINIATENRWFTDLPHDFAPFFPFVNWSF